MLPKKSAHSSRKEMVLPTAFSWRNIRGYGTFLTASQNQHVPVYCGACFAFGAFHVLQDRTKIARFLTSDDKWRAPDALVAHQVMLNCGPDVAGSCEAGGTAPGVWRWVKMFGGVPLAGCQPYEAVDGKGCAPENICRNCMPSPGDAWTLRHERSCWAVPGNRVDHHPCAGDDFCATNPYPRIDVADFGGLPSALDVGPLEASLGIMREIARAGPVTCDIDAEAIMDYTGDDVIEDPVGNRTEDDTDHVIEVVGWGTDENGKPYWEIRNSWGEYWGDAGFGKIYRGRNDMLIETRCYWVSIAGWGSPDTHRYQAFQSDDTENDSQMQDLIKVSSSPKKQQRKSFHQLRGVSQSTTPMSFLLFGLSCVFAIAAILRLSSSSS